MFSLRSLLELGILIGMILFHDSFPQFILIRIAHLPVAILGDHIGILFIKLNTPFEKEFEGHPHGMGAGFHDDEITLGQ